MASLLDRFRGPRTTETTSDTASPDAPTPAPRRRPLPPPSQLRRDRRNLLRVREQHIRDLGGLVLEMYRQDRFRQDLVYEQAAQIVAVEERLREVDALLAAATTRRVAPAARCSQCATPLLAGARFCPACGHAVTVEQQA